jgi:hypothetical protein
MLVHAGEVKHRRMHPRLYDRPQMIWKSRRRIMNASKIFSGSGIGIQNLTI